METMLKTALLVVASDHGIFLLRKSLIKPFPIPITKEYIAEISKVSEKFSRFFSSVERKKKIRVVAKDTQNKMIKSLRFIGQFILQK